MSQRQPRTLFLAAVDALLNEVHPFDTIVDVRIDCLVSDPGFAFGTQDHIVIGSTIDIGKRFEECLGWPLGKRQLILPQSVMNGAFGSRV